MFILYVVESGRGTDITPAQDIGGKQTSEHYQTKLRLTYHTETNQFISSVLLG